MSEPKRSTRSTKTQRSVAVVMAAGLLVAACGSTDQSDVEPTTTEAPTTTESTTASSTETETTATSTTAAAIEETEEVVDVSEPLSQVSSPTRLSALPQPLTISPDEAVNANQIGRALSLTNSAGNFDASVEWPLGVANPDALDPGFVVDPQPVPADIDQWLAQLPVVVESTGATLLFGQEANWWQVVVDEPAVLDQVGAPIIALWTSSDEPTTPESTRVDRQIGPGVSLTFAVIFGDDPIIVSSEFPAAFEWATNLLATATLD